MKSGVSLGNIPQKLKKKTCYKNSIYFELKSFQYINCTLIYGLTFRNISRFYNNFFQFLWIYLLIINYIFVVLVIKLDIFRTVSPFSSVQYTVIEFL
jgi:hypothetical protein